MLFEVLGQCKQVLLRPMQESSAKSAAKAARKAIPANFVEIIDTLVDKLASYKGVILSGAPRPGDVAKEDAAEGSAADTQMESAPSTSQPPAAGTGPQANSKPAQDAAKDKQVLQYCRSTWVRVKMAHKPWQELL